MSKIKVAIVTGGDSSEYVVSLKSAENVVKCIDNTKFEPFVVLIRGSEWKVMSHNDIAIDKQDFSFQFNGSKITFDCVLLAPLHGAPAENGILQGYFEMLKIPYIGCGVLSSALTFNKYSCNQFLKTKGISLANSIALYKNDKIDVASILKQISLPCFVKPNEAGSSFGVTKVTSAEKLIAAIENAFKEDKNSIIIEEAIDGMEIANGVFKLNDEITVLPITEVVSKNEFFDFDAKYKGQVEEITPARISKEVEERVKALTAQVYRFLYCEGIVRVDYIIKSNGEPFFLEVNTLPGMTGTSFIPQQMSYAGISLSEIFTKLIEEKLK